MLALSKFVIKSFVFVLLLSGSSACMAQQYRYTASLPATDALGRTLPTSEEVGLERQGRFNYEFTTTNK